jgi:predicted RNase H-like nuclease (RuvC/YqgF family)
MTEEFINDLLAQWDTRFVQQGKAIEKLEAEVSRLTCTTESQTDDITHLQEQVVALQRSNSALHQWNIDHSLEHDQERLRLKKRVLLLEDTLRTHDIPIPA